MEHEHILIIIASALAVCVVCQWLAWRIKLPAILLLLLAGFTGGPLLGVVEPELLLGDFFFPFVSLSVAIILFEGSITLKFREILGLESVVRNMLSVGLLITWGCTALAAKFIVGVSWEIAFLFGSITVVTGPTVIAPLLRTVRPSPSVANILRWEGIVIDPIGATLAVLVYEFIIAESLQEAWGQTVITFFVMVTVGCCIGAAAGYLFGQVLRRHWLPEFLINVATLTLIFASFVLADVVQPESGLVAVTVFGMWLANMPGVDLEEILQFKESLSILLISLLFLMLTARLDIAALQELGLAAVLVFLVVQLVARPLNVFCSSYGSTLKMAERYFLAWVAPRGIVAAAISSLFAIRLEQAGYMDARYLVPLTFTIIIGTVFLQSLTARPLAQLLNIAEPEPRGFLLIGANRVARAIAGVLKEHGFRVLLVDTDWEKLREARLAGLEVYHGSPISEPTDRHMNLSGIGRLLALAPHASVNIAAVMHYRHELGKNKVFTVRTKSEDDPGGDTQLPVQYGNSYLFSSSVTYQTLHDGVSAGAVIKSTLLSDEYAYTDYQADNGTNVLELFRLDPKGRLVLVTDESKTMPESGWHVIALHHTAAYS